MNNTLGLSKDDEEYDYQLDEDDFVDLMEDHSSLKHVFSKRYMQWKKMQREEESQGDDDGAGKSLRRPSEDQDASKSGILAKLKNIFKSDKDESDASF